MTRRAFFPTATSVAVLINGYHVEFAYRVDWAEDQPKIPIYNYNAVRYGRVMAGRQLVQGFLVVNFVHPGYLTEVLKVTKGGPVLRLAGTDVTNEFSLQDPIVKRVKDEMDKLTGLTAEDKKHRIQVMSSLLKSNKGKNRDLVVRGIRERSNPPDSVGIRKVLSPIHVPPNRGNTMEIYYHDVNHVRWYTIFYDVEFTKITQQISAAGAEGSSEPLYEVHEFIASFRETNEIKIQQE